MKVALRESAFEVEGAFGLARRVERQLVHPVMERRRLFLQAQIQLVVRELVAQEVLHLL